MRLVVPILMMLQWTSVASALSIAEVQYSSAAGPDGTWPSDREGEVVTITGVVTGTEYINTRFFLQDVEGGPWSGILIWDGNIYPQRGDLLQITGTVLEYNGHTEISPVSEYVLLDQNQPLPAPYDLNAQQVSTEEMWEGVLARIEGVVVSEAQDSFGQWWVEDDSGSCEVDDAFFPLGNADLDPQPGDPLAALTGIVDYQYGNRAINPRDPQDLQVFEGLFLHARDTEIPLNQTGICWLECGELTVFDAVDGYEITLSIPGTLVDLTGLVTAGSLSSGRDPQFQVLGDDRVQLSLPPGDVMAGGLPLLGLSLEALQPGEGALDLEAATLGASELEQLSSGTVNVLPAAEGIGDTLTLIMRPLLNIPSIVTQGDKLEVWADAPTNSSGWSAALLREGLRQDLELDSVLYDFGEQWWHLWFDLPVTGWTGLADLELDCDAMPCDTSWHAVRLHPQLPDSYYIAHITDTHLPTHRYYTETGALQDSASMGDLREVFADLDLINPAFILLTGDVINEGELEDFLQARYFTRTQRLLAESEVPIHVVAGNHDLGGWTATPPEDGTSRRDWWRFFGWPRLDSPPAGAPERTQNYWFSHGNLHCIGLESYVNYDGFRPAIYGETSFLEDQLTWLNGALGQAQAGQKTVLFYHMDFADQLDHGALGVDLALWGHIHGDSGSLNGPTWSLSTDQVTDHGCAFRLIRVTPDGIQPLATEHACDGDPLSLAWSGPNDGSQDSLHAVVHNGYGLEFPEAVLRARLAPGISSVEVTGGTLLQLLETDQYTLVEANVPLTPGSTSEVWFAATASILEPPELSIHYQSGLVTIHWLPVPSAAGYRVEGRTGLLDEWRDVTEGGQVQGTSWTVPAAHPVGMFRVVALD